MAVALPDLPKYLVVAPSSTLRLDMHLDCPSCEIDISLDNPKPGRSFVLMIGHPGGPYVQRARLAGSARVIFDPESPGDYALVLSNPDPSPIVLHLRGRGLGVRPSRTRGTRRKPRARSFPGARRRGRATRAKPTPRSGPS